MDQFSTLCRYIAILLVSFEYVCGGDGWGLWKELNAAEKSYGVTILLQSPQQYYQEVLNIICNILINRGSKNMNLYFCSSNDSDHS